ncbi:MAG: exodeoxyribonuclease V subunit gamma, partial [Bradymonadaceae bacterium]|nr:exodeoxyribonuclease V subunit gamma [Lujinxingiaceae bacterium]
AERGLRYVRISEVFGQLAPSALIVPEHTHVFGLSYVAPLFETIFAQFKRRAEGIYFYTLNPCEAFWEDVRPGAEDEDVVLESTTGLFDLELDTPALRLWGRPGRDNTRMLNRLSETVYETSLFEVSDSEQPTLLQALQADIRERAPKRSRAAADARFDDESIRFLACPSVQREVEVVANEIWSLMEQSKGSLRFNDIAVIVNHAQREVYQTHIRSVFKDTHDIAHNIIDIASASQNRLVEAADLLFSLPFGDFRRRELLKLITHPNVMANFPGVEAEQWLGWCHELHILHGADHADHDHTYIKADLLNWKQGMRRLVLGAFMSDHRSGEDRAFLSADQAYLPYEYSHTELGASSSLVLLVQSLIADARFCKSERLPLRQWARLMGAMLTTYLDTVDEGDARELMRCHQILTTVADNDLSGAAVSYRVAYEFVREALDVLETQRGQYLVDGVVVTSFLPMRPIPFKVVFVTGMGEGKFPIADRQNPLDLRLAEWREGDVRGREQDKYMFLETLISTRERMYLSWVSRDNRTGDPLEPSSVVKELNYMLEGYEGSEHLRRRLEEHPLRRHDRAYFPALYADATRALPAYGREARREAKLCALRADLLSFCKAQGVEFPQADELARSIDPGLWQTLSERLGLIGRSEQTIRVLDDDESERGPARISLGFWQVRRFLECPLQASANLVVGLRDIEEEDLFAIENEVFETGSWPQTLLLRDVFLRHVAAHSPRRGQPLSQIYDERARYLELQGVLPTGLFQSAERHRHVEMLETWVKNMQAFGFAPGGPLEILRFGRAAEQVIADEIYDSIILELPQIRLPSGARRDVRVELFGESQALNLERDVSMTMLARDDVRPRDFLAGYLDHVFLAAAGRQVASGPRRVLVNTTKAMSADVRFTRRLAPISTAQARAYLGRLVTEMLSGVHDYLMPIEAVVAFSALDNRQSFGQITAQLLGQAGGCSSLYGPVRHPEHFLAPGDELARTMIRSRFGPFLAMAEQVGA